MPSRLRRWSLVAFAVGVSAGIALPPTLLTLSVLSQDISTARQRKPALQRYAFEHGLRSSVRIEERGFVSLPACGDCDTALLSLRLSANWLGRFIFPSIEIWADGKFVGRQYFPAAVEGEYTLNVSGALPRLPSRSRSVELRSRGLLLKRQSAVLWQFANRPLDGTRLLVLAPHPDDAEIASFGLYSRHASYVVTVTAGEAGVDHYEAFVHDQHESFLLKAKLRVWDSLTVPWLGGVSPDRAFNLGYYDGTLAEMYDHPDRSPPSTTLLAGDRGALRYPTSSPLLPQTAASPTWNTLVADLALILEATKPDVIVAPHPLLDTHSDHDFTSVALLEALGRRPTTDVRLYFYTNHAPTSEQFPFGWRDGLVALPPTADSAVTVGSIHSLALGDEAQRSKLFALNATHELGIAPPSGVRGGLVARVKEAIRDQLYGEGVRPNSNYYRRGARPNEIFFVYDVAGGQRLRETFLGARARPKGGDAARAGDSEGMKE